jgi:hypothetical protein
LLVALVQGLLGVWLGTALCGLFTSRRARPTGRAVGNPAVSSGAET